MSRLQARHYVYIFIGAVIIYVLFSNLFGVAGQTTFSGGTVSVPGSSAYWTTETKSSGNSNKIQKASKISYDKSYASATDDVAVAPKNKRMVIRKSRVEMKVTNILTALSEVKALTARSNGFVSSSYFYDRGKYERNQAQMVLRIPTEGLVDAIESLKKIAVKITAENMSGQDITDQYTDLQSKLKTLESANEQLMLIMKKARKIPDILSVLREQQRIQAKIDLLKGRIQYFKQSVSLSTVTVILVQEAISQPQIDKPSFITQAFKSALDNLLEFCKQVLATSIYLVVYIIPLLLVWLVILALVFYVGHYVYKRVVYKDKM